MKKIKLTQGKFSIVDDKDFDYLNQWKWHYLAMRSGYAKRTIALGGGKYKAQQMHRLLMNASEDQQVDHIDGNGLNNQRKNLRISTPSQNMMNRGKFRKSKSKYKGVSWHKQNRKWQVSISKDGKRKYIGIYNTELEAAKAYNEHAVKIHGKYANINVIDP